MKFEVNRKDFLKALDEVSKANVAYGALPFLYSVLLDADDSGVKLTCNNLEFAIRKELSARVLDPGKAMIEVSTLKKLVKKLDSETISLTNVVKGEEISVIIGAVTSSITVRGCDPEIFPPMPTIQEGIIFEIEESKLRWMISQTIHAVSSSDNRPIHTGILFNLRDNHISLVAVDGYKLSVAGEPVQSEERQKFVVPGACANSIIKLLETAGDGSVTVKVDEKYAVLTFGDYVVSSRLLDGEFLNYEGSIPKPSDKNVIVAVKTIMAALKRANEMNAAPRKAKRAVEMLFEGNNIRLTVKTSLGLYEENIQCDRSSISYLRIGFDAQMLLDAFKAVDCESVKVELTTELSPLIILPVDDTKDFLHLVLPSRLKDENVA